MGCQTASSSTTTATTPPHSSGIIPWTGSERSRRVLSAQTAALSSPTSVHAKPTPSHQMLESLSFGPETHSRMFLNRPQSVPRPFPTRAVVQGDLGGRLAGARPTTALIQPQQGDAGRAPPGMTDPSEMRDVWRCSFWKARRRLLPNLTAAHLGPRRFLAGRRSGHRRSAASIRTLRTAGGPCSAWMT